MALKQLNNKIILIFSLFISTVFFSQMKMIDINGKKLIINSKTEERNFVKIFDDDKFSVFYVVNRRDFNLKKGLKVGGTANIIYFSKKYNKGILTNFEQVIGHNEKNIFDISLYVDKNVVIPFMIIVNKDFKYEYLMKSYYILPPSTQSTIYKSGITIQDYNNQCNLKKMSLNKIIVDEDIDDILKILEKETIISQECGKLFEIEDFPKKLSK